MTKELIWKIRHNGVQHKTGWGYRIEIPPSDRDAYFSQDWSAAYLDLPTAGKYTRVKVNVAKRSFWHGKSHYLISVEVGNWLLKQKLAPWRRGYPPRIRVEAKGEGHFRVIRAIRMRSRNRHGPALSGNAPR
jgi:hypothetical protein